MNRSSEASICQCREDVKVRVQEGRLEDSLSNLCARCQTNFLELASNILQTNHIAASRKKEPAVTRRRKQRTPASGERLLETIPGVSQGAMVDSRRAMHESYSQLYKREQQLLKAVAELENQMALRNQPLPSPASTPRQQMQVHTSGKTSPTDPDVDLLADAFGVVALRNRSDVQFLGTTAISEVDLSMLASVHTYILKALRWNHEECRVFFPSSFTQARKDMQFPCPPPQPPTDLSRILVHLPDYDRAQELVKNYVYFVTWLASPIPLANISETLSLFYPNKCPIQRVNLRMGHCLAGLFAMFLFGSHFDMHMSDEERATDCAKYMTLARATMSCVPLSEHATVDGIQCMVLLIWFSRFSPSSSNVGYQWAFSGFLAKLVQSLGLHTNGRSYAGTQGEKQIKRAEQTFWEYYMQDVFQSYVFGRPVTLHPSVIGCQWPEVEVYDDYHPEFFQWKYSMTMIMTVVIENTVQSNVAYSAIRKLDRQVRHHFIPSGMEWPNSDGETKARGEPFGKTLQRAFGSILTQMVLMILHRPYFWEAISKPDHNLMRHPYWGSVVAAYHGASSLVSTTRAIWQMFPEALERFAPFWSHCHSASLILGALVTLRPDSQFSRESVKLLDAACEMFKAANEGVSHLASRLPALYRLQKKAQETYQNYVTSTDASTPEILSPASLSCLEESDHVDINSKNGHDDSDSMMLDPGVYRLQEKGWDHLILQLGRHT